MIFLTNEHIQQVLDMPTCLKAMEEAYRDLNEERAGYRPRIDFYVPEEPHLYPHLTGREYLQLVGRLRGLNRRTLERRMDQMLRLFSLWEDRHSPLSSYSKGMRQKVGLAIAAG